MELELKQAEDAYKSESAELRGTWDSWAAKGVRESGLRAAFPSSSEARAAARAALGAQEQSNLDKELYDECFDESKGDWDKVREILNRGAAPDGYKVRRKQAAHSTACLVCSFSFFSRILWCRFLFFSVRFSFLCSFDD